MIAQMTSDYHGNNETDLEGMLSKLYELKTEISTMRRNFENLESSGEFLLSGKHYAAEIIKDRLEELRQGWSALLTSWENRSAELEKRKEAENMNREVTQLEAWLLNQEADLSLNDVGNSLENVEDLLKKQDEMERMLLAQEERFLSLIQPMDDDSLDATDEVIPDLEHDASSLVEHVDELTDKSLASDDFSCSTNIETAGLSGLENLQSLSNPQREILSANTTSASEGFSTSENCDPVEVSEVFGTEDNSEVPEMDSMTCLSNLISQSDKPIDMITQRDEQLDSTDLEKMMDSNAKLPKEVAEIIDTTENCIASSLVEAVNRETSLDKDESGTSGLKKIDDAGKLDAENSTAFSEAFDEGIERNSFKPESKYTLYKEPASSSERILGVTPLCAGILKRKQETDASGQRSVAQPWRSYYTVLSEDILQFFKDLDGFKSKWHVSKPMSLVGASCEHLRETSRQGYIFRVVFRDRSEYLFATENEEECKLWVGKVNSVIKMAARFGDGNDVGSVEIYHDDEYGVFDGGSNSRGSREGNVVDGVTNPSDDGQSLPMMAIIPIDYGSRNSVRPRGDHAIDARNYDSGDFQDHKRQNSDIQTLDTPSIVITDPNSNDEFLVEDDTHTDTHSSVHSYEDPHLSDEDAISLPDHSEYNLPSWYPAAATEPSIEVLETKDKENDIPPPVPNTPPPSDIHPNPLPDLPENLPPSSGEDLSDILGFIPPPVLDPSFDFLVETKNEVRVINCA